MDFAKSIFVMKEVGDKFKVAIPMTDYEKIKRSCLKRGELWEDPDFPATQSSVFYHQTPPFQFSWKRPKRSKFKADVLSVEDFTSVRCSAATKLETSFNDQWYLRFPIMSYVDTFSDDSCK
ncbi:hypothetical protein RUM44_009769 [Polyplax serrata]|uniref:Calpain catalytic domain-containing protein n=1 Tax=Polyplax serrata TaxID=468196 RepID=A0ABR1ATP8_POLSC